jgi:hypothetical protein
MTTNPRLGRLALLAALALSASACAGTIKNMREVPPGSPEPKPAAGKAMVVFLRPSGMGYAIQSSVFVVKDKNPELVGIVAAKTKVAWQADPGKHLFMVVGESGDFMGAELEAGKTYFATVAPRLGMWKARFSLKPVGPEEAASPAFVDGLNGSRWVEKDEAAEAWARGHADEVRSKYEGYYPKWMEKAEADRPWLRTTDGK